MNFTYHVIPDGDHVEHEMSEECACGPTPELWGSGWVVVHHALDGRD